MYTWYSASSQWIITAEALRYGTCSQGISQFYLHNHTFIRNWDKPYLPLPSQPQLVLIYRPRRDGRLSRPWCEVAQAETRSRSCHLSTASPALPHSHERIYVPFVLPLDLRDSRLTDGVSLDALCRTMLWTLSAALTVLSAIAPRGCSTTIQHSFKRTHQPLNTSKLWLLKILNE